MKIMTSNLCSWGEGSCAISQRMPRIKTVYEKYAPDFIGVQECTEDWLRYLQRELSDYALIGCGRDPESTGEASCIFYRKESFTVSDPRTFWLSETPEKVSLGWDGACRRVCTTGIFTELTMGNKLSFFNTHLDHIGQEAQLHGGELIRQEILKSSPPCILTGDFNVTETSAVYGLFRGLLQDTRYAAKESTLLGTWHNFGEFTNIANELPIDHIFVSPAYSVLSYTVIEDKIGEEYISDHYPVLVEIQPQKKD
ncbi:MAG: endonuclease/exonuclease/phosphatase family protein [Oscillospiraceae bacterium]